MIALLAENDRAIAANVLSRAAVAFVPNGGFSAQPAIPLMGGVNRDIGSSIPISQVGLATGGTPWSTSPLPAP
eukprot:4953156-Heterocapsa_arctica.AAC.1